MTNRSDLQYQDDAMQMALFGVRCRSGGVGDNAFDSERSSTLETCREAQYALLAGMWKGEVVGLRGNP